MRANLKAEKRCSEELGKELKEYKLMEKELNRLEKVNDQSRRQIRELKLELDEECEEKNKHTQQYRRKSRTGTNNENRKRANRKRPDEKHHQ